MKAGEARCRWAKLLRRIFEVEPLECPRCGSDLENLPHSDVEPG